MDVELTSEHAMLLDATRAFLESQSPAAKVRRLATQPEGFDADEWVSAASLGWCAMFASEEYGGVGLDHEGVIGAAIVAEELGRALYPGPFLPVTVVVDAVSRVGSLPQKRYLAGLVAGRSIGTWAICEGPGRWDVRDLTLSARREGDGFVIRGVKRWVQDLGSAELVLLTCLGDDGAIQFLVPTDTPGMRRTPLSSADIGRRFADVEFDDLYVGAEMVLGDGVAVEDQVFRQMALASVLQCAETVGATDRILNETVAYALDRMAFGRPIGGFQAVKHRLAEAATWLEAAQAATWAAAHALSENRPDLARAVHIAKGFVAHHCPRIIEDCMQVQGGVAMTWENDCHLYLRRVRTNAMLYGTSRWHADRLCDLLGMTV